MPKYWEPGLNRLADDFQSVARSKGFSETTDENLPGKLMLVVSELAEAMEDHRAGKPTLYFEGSKPCGLATEIADAIIRLLHICADLQIDITNAVETKALYNETRPAMHGGKRY